MRRGQTIYGSYDNYKLLESLASGSFGWVWKAYTQTNKQQVAIKFFIPDSDSRTDFDNEVEAYAVLSEDPYCDPFIVCMYDYGRDETGLYFIVQELMDGDLTRFTTTTKRHARIILSDSYSVALFMIQCLEGLRHIHASGMAHLDIKPGNLLYSVSKEIINPNRFFNDWNNIRYHTCFKFGDPGFACTTSVQRGKRHRIRKSNLHYVEAESWGDVPSLRYVALCEFRGSPNYVAPQFYEQQGNPPLSNNEFYQKNDVWGLGQVFRAVLFGENSIVPVYGEDWLGYFYSKIDSQSEIVPLFFNSTHSCVDKVINIVINDGMLRYDYVERADAIEMLLILNNAIETSLFEEKRNRERKSMDFLRSKTNRNIEKNRI